jgi:hypothetical protein
VAVRPLYGRGAHAVVGGVFWLVGMGLFYDGKFSGRGVFSTPTISVQNDRFVDGRLGCLGGENRSHYSLDSRVKWMAGGGLRGQNRA